MNYPVYPAYINDLQAMRDRIDKQIQAQQYQQPPAINQTFQLAPQIQSELDAKYAKDVEEVKNMLALKETLFIDKDITSLWIKKADGSIKTYKLEEIIELDEKDKTILDLQKQINELKEMMSNGKSDNSNVNESTKTTKSRSVSTNKSNDVDGN